MIIFLFGACERRLGYGILLWAADEPPIPSGVVLPVFIRSNIDHVWVAGIPDEYKTPGSRIDKFEIPLAKLELAGSKKKAEQRAAEFAPHALSYAETLQDGLPIREFPDNGARRVYRLRMGEIIKIMNPAKGTEAVGTTGDALPGEWFRVLTENGTIGYCFSYRLRIFEHGGGNLAAIIHAEESADDPELDKLLTRAWSAEVYSGMINSRRINLNDLRRNWGFDPGIDTGLAQIRTRDIEKSFAYTAIRPTGSSSWRFEGAPLSMELRSDNSLAVQYTEEGGALRTLMFVALPTSVEDLIIQETARRDQLFSNIFRAGPVFSSHNYGTITFFGNGSFTWVGNDLLIPQVIPAAALGNGVVDMRLSLAAALGDRYTGAFTLCFSGLGGSLIEVDFMYTVEPQGFRLEYVPATSLDGIVVTRRSNSPLVLYFFKVEPQVFSTE